MTIQKQILAAGHWKAIPPEIFEDPRLSLDSRAVVGFIVTRSDSFKLRATGLCNILKIGKDKWRRIRNELEQAGYLAPTQSKGHNGKFTHDLNFSPIPRHGFIASKRKASKKQNDEPAAVNPPTGAPELASKSATKKPDYLLDPPPSPHALVLDNMGSTSVESWDEVALFEAQKFVLSHTVTNFDGLLFRIQQRYRKSGGPSLNVLKQFRAHQARLALNAHSKKLTQEHEASTSNAAAQHPAKRNAAEQLAQSLSPQQRQTMIEHAEAANQSFRMRPNARRAFLANGAIQPGPFAAILTELLTAMKGDT